MKTVKYLLLGGGYTLTELTKFLLKDSFVITVRNPDKLKLLKMQGFNAEFLDLQDSESIADVFKKYPAIRQIVDSIPPDRSDCSGSTLKGLKNLAENIDLSLFDRIIYLSTTGVFGVDDGSWVDENTPASPKHDSSILRLESEEFYRSKNSNVTALRISAIYGPGRGIGIALKNGYLKLVDQGSRWSNRIHVTDLAQAIKKILDLKDPPPVLAIADDRPSQICDVVEFYCNKFNLKEPESISADQALARGMYHFLSNQRISNKLIKETLKLELKFPSYLIGAGEEFSKNDA